jgi:Mg2+ and Co2+ transporter CorA
MDNATRLPDAELPRRSEAQMILEQMRETTSRFQRIALQLDHVMQSIKRSPQDRSAENTSASKTGGPQGAAVTLFESLEMLENENGRAATKLEAQLKALESWF